ncbi:hypothetical protein [Bradyrhizobium sp. RDM4]|uniref:hypothetical protein n=1 Tax=Bradyrhizobium sp. RDM4 TaxID=3378765 RepID=UPI0038FCB0A3
MSPDIVTLPSSSMAASIRRMRSLDPPDQTAKIGRDQLSAVGFSHGSAVPAKFDMGILRPPQ